LSDGYCNLCSRAVQWILRNDRADRFRLVPLQEEKSEANTEIIAEKPGRSERDSRMESPGGGDPDTVLLLRDGRIYSRSTAVLMIASRLRFPWPLLSALMVIPRFLRDPLYDLVARNRKRWFGERASCYLPPGSYGNLPRSSGNSP